MAGKHNNMLSSHQIPGAWSYGGSLGKGGFILLQPQLWPHLAPLAALLAEVQVPAVLTQR